MRYLRLYLHFLRFSFSKAMHFRMDFFFRVVMDVFYYLFQFLFFNIIYLHTPILGGWNIEQITLFICGFIFIDSLNMTIFANNCWWFPIHVNRGDMDYYLTKPISTLFFMSVKEFAANSFLNLIIATGILGWGISQYSGELETIDIFVFVLLLINGTILYAMVHFLFLMSVFWTSSPRGFADMFYSLQHVMERPDRIFTGIFKTIFSYILPFSLMVSYPARYLLEGQELSIIFKISIVTISMALFVLFIWKRGLRNYSSASS